MKIGKSESDKAAEDLLACRKIVNEIVQFGVSQQQILQIIYLMALELEDREAILNITAVVKEFQNNPLEDQKKKLLEV